MKRISLFLAAISVGFCFVEPATMSRSRRITTHVMYNEGPLTVRAKLKRGKMHYAPILPELEEELRRYFPRPAKDNVLFIAKDNHDLIFPPKADAGSGPEGVGKFRRLARAGRDRGLPRS